MNLRLIKENEAKSHLRFRNKNTATQLKTAIQSLFDEAKQESDGVFADDEKIKLTPDHLQVCLGSLEEWKLFNSNLDVVDDAFEYLVNQSAKGEKGQCRIERRPARLDLENHSHLPAAQVSTTAAGS